MQCEFCGGETKKRNVKRQHWFQRQLYIVENIEAEVCAECGERYFHAKTLDAVDALLLKQALIIVPASAAHLESKASALACRSKAEALDSSRPVPRLAGTMIKALKQHAVKETLCVEVVEFTKAAA